MKQTLVAVVISLTVGIYLGMSYAFGPVGALTALVNLFGVAIIVVCTLFLVVLCWSGVSSWRAEEVGDVEAARRAYANGEIPLAELERRVDIALDPTAQRLRKLVEDVNGVGPETSAAIAAEFMTVEALKNASPADLEKIYGIGPNTAYAIHRRFSYGPQSAPVDEIDETETQ